MFSPLQDVLEALRLGSASKDSEAPSDLLRGLAAVFDDCSPLPSICLLGDSHRITAEQVNFLAKEARGVICAAVSEERRKFLGLPLMADVSQKATSFQPGIETLREDSRQFDFTVSVEARHGVSTGISAADRAKTLNILASTCDPRRDLITPGHIFPARTHTGGVLVRASLAEAAMDLLNLAQGVPGDSSASQSSTPAFVQCLDSSGGFLSPESAHIFLQKHKIPAVQLSDLIRYRLAHERLVQRVAEAKLPMEIDKDFRAVCFRSQVDGAEHLALVYGDLNRSGNENSSDVALVRVQAEKPFEDIFGFDETRGIASLRSALAEIRRHGLGVLVYIRHPDRLTRAQTPESGTSSPSTFRALRELGIGAQILLDLGIKRLKILSRQQRDLSALAAFPLEILDQVIFSSEQSHFDDRIDRFQEIPR